MTDLEQIQKRAMEGRLDFLLIGGLAVIEHGFARLTTDLDLLVRKHLGEAWKGMLIEMGYALINEKDSFQQYERPGVATWPLDLMLVNDSTYEKLSAASLPIEVMGASIRMVSLNHLLALKLHVLKQGKIHRFLDDLIDVAELVKANRLDLQSSELRDLFLKHGNAQIYDKVQRLVKAD
jgi:hypothetical protein